MWSCSDYEEVVVETRVGHITWLGADPAVDMFLPAKDQNCKRVVRVQYVELCRLPYTLLLLIMYCIRKTRASLVTINRAAHVVEEKSQGQAEGKQQVVAKTRRLDEPEHNFTAIFLVASREYP